METLHHINIGIHVLAGTAALIMGFAALIISKGSKRHIRFGRIFTWLIIVVIITGLAGILIFKRNNFLLVITMLSGYNCFSGIRAIKLRGRRPTLLDCFVPVIVMASAIYYLYYLHSSGLYWSPVIVYSTVGTLFSVTIYDLFKLAMTNSARIKTIMYEHAYKMISALTALTSAFSGTVFPQYKPYSQFLPSVIGLLFIIATFIWLAVHQSSPKYKLKPITI